jgi:hypothetical protein
MKSRRRLAREAWVELNQGDHGRLSIGASKSNGHDCAAIVRSIWSGNDVAPQARRARTDRPDATALRRVFPDVLRRPGVH